MELWIARDKNGGLFMYVSNPTCDEETKTFWTENEEFFRLSKNFFPEVTFENSPQKVKIELIKNSDESKI